MILGGHVSAAGGVLKALDRAASLEFEAIQIHPSAPQTWKKPATSDEEAAEFKMLAPSKGVKATFFHNIYLGNFAAEQNGHWQGTIEITKSYLTLAAKMGALGVVTHTGSHKGNGFDTTLQRVTEGIGRALAESPAEAKYLIENTAGAGGTIGRTLEEIEQIITPLWKHYPNVGICIDTCHAFASGIPIHEPAGLEAFLTEFDERFSLEALTCIHLNDSKTPFNSNRDRHENIGDGELGLEAFRTIVNHPKLQTVPLIMEVPGIENTGPDAINRDRVKALRRA